MHTEQISTCAPQGVFRIHTTSRSERYQGSKPREKHFFVSCYITFQKGISSLFEKCDDRIEIRNIYHPRFQNCFSMDIPVFDSSRDIALTNGLSLIIFLDFLPNGVERPFLWFGPENSIGALVVMSKKTAMPFARSEFVSLSPGNQAFRPESLSVRSDSIVLNFYQNLRIDLYLSYVI